MEIQIIFRMKLEFRIERLKLEINLGTELGLKFENI